MHDGLNNRILADRIQAEMIHGFHKLAQTPRLGHCRRGLADEPLRFRTVRQYLIICRIEPHPLGIVLIVHQVVAVIKSQFLPGLDLPQGDDPDVAFNTRSAS